MGTMLQAHNPTLADFGGAGLENCNENLCRTHPEWMLDIHRAYLEAGADIIETNSFQGSPIVLAEFRLEDQTHELNVLAAKLARQAADEFSTTAKPRFVAGSMGPTTKSITLRGDVTFAANARQLLRAGARTDRRRRGYSAGRNGLRHAQHQGRRCSPSSNSNATWAFASRLMVSGTIERWGAMLAGQPVDAFYASVAHADLLSIGLNCATGPDLMTDHIRTLAEMASTRISCYPNAGLPNEEDKYLETPEIAGRPAREICRARLAEHRRRMLRHHAGAYPRHRADGRRQSAARGPGAVAHALIIPASNWSRPKTPTAR